LKLSEIRPCDFCSGSIAPIFTVIETKIAVFDARSINETLGLMQIWGERSGRTLALAEAMGPNPDAVRVSESDELNVKLFCCQSCLLKGGLDISVAAEKLTAREYEKSKTQAARTNLDDDRAEQATPEP
jgi:hypothetical protein